MTLPTYSPFEVQLDKFLGDVLRSASGQAAVWAPACNAFEDVDRFWVEASIPGMESKDIEITVEDDLLTIKGERKEETHSGVTYLAKEMTSGPFSRVFRLPQQVDATRVSASYKNGILRVELPKREEVKPRRITIE
jgi:HSP20 family protein